MSRGVARIACAGCAFSFVMRLGDPNAKKQEPSRDPLQPVDIDGVRSSGGGASAVGEIGQPERPRFVPAQTHSSIKLSPDLLAMIAEDEARQAAQAAGQVDITLTPDDGAFRSGRSGDDDAEDDEPATEPEPLPPPPLEISASRAARQPTQREFSTATATGPPPSVDPGPLPFTPTLQDTALPATPTLPMESPAVAAVAVDPTSEPAAVEKHAAASPSAAPNPAARPPVPPPGLAHPPAQSEFETFGELGTAGTGAPAPVVPMSPAQPMTPVSAMTAVSTGPTQPTQPMQSLSTGPMPPGQMTSEQLPSLMTTGPMPAALDPARMIGPMPAVSRAPAMDVFMHDPSMDLYGVDTPQEGRFVRGVGKLMLLIVVGGMSFGIFVLYRNNWQFDPSNLDRMLDRALGRATTPITGGGSLLRDLRITKPVVAQAKFIDGKKVVTASGVIHNMGVSAKRYIYVRARLKHGSRVIVTAKAPAGNSFNPEELATLNKESLYALVNPAGKNGRNAKIEPKKSVDYMVVFTELPQDYSPERYTVEAKITAAEPYQGP